MKVVCRISLPLDAARSRSYPRYPVIAAARVLILACRYATGEDTQDSARKTRWLRETRSYNKTRNVWYYRR